MASLLRLPQQEHFAFDPALDLNVREGFRAGDKVLAGVHQTSWQRDEAVWGFRRGLFRGGDKGRRAFLRSVPSNLRVDGATLETDGNDPLERIAAGNISVSCEVAYDLSPSRVRNIEFRLYSCATEAHTTLFAARSQNSPLTSTVNFPGVAAGSYILWARCYDTYDGYDETEQLALDNTGEWAALKVRVGAGSFSIAASKCPSPGCALYVKNGADAVVSVDANNTTTGRVLFDPLARSVSASCVIDTAIRFNDGTFDVNAGSQIIAGLRASRSGPQSALWLLHSDLTARLLATTEIFSTGKCECGKSDHHASDVVQGPDGTLYLLSECSLHQYAPDEASIGERLPGSPRENGGHPGGQTLRFLSNNPNFFTEIFEDEEPDDLGTYFYARLVQRLNQRDVIGAGPSWHGPGEVEAYHGALWGFRGEGDLTKTTGKVFFDRFEGGSWSGNTLNSYNATTDFWRQLRRRGNLLFWFGFNSGSHLDTEVWDPLAGSTDTPICAVCDGQKIRRAQFDYLVKRVTRCKDADGGDTLLVVCNDTATGQTLRNGGRALRVVELPSVGTDSRGNTKVCAFWNESPAEFRLSKSAFIAAGGDLAKFPLYFKWKAESGRNGGGVWVASATLPTAPYLTTSTTSTLIKLTLTGTAPYSFLVWGLFCVSIGVDGSVTGGGGGNIEPGSTPTNAQEAFDAMPEGTKFRVIQREVPFAENPLWAVQLTDLSPDKNLVDERSLYPCVWARVDSIADLEELTSYTDLLKYSRAQATSDEAKQMVDVVVLVSPDNQPCVAPAVGRRFN